MKLKFLQFLFLLFLIVFTAYESEPENKPQVANDLLKINVSFGFIDDNTELYVLA